jgi:hypothetical protein
MMTGLTKHRSRRIHVIYQLKSCALKLTLEWPKFSTAGAGQTAALGAAFVADNIVLNVPVGFQLPHTG